MNISIPVALQSMLQSSFSMIDQVMAGQPVDQSVAAVEIASRPGFIYAFLISAISTIAAIMTSQYIGKNNREAEEKTLCINLLVMLIVGSCFLLAFSIFRDSFISLFSNDHPVEQRGIQYLQVIVLTFIPLGICNILSVPLRCHNHSMWPLYIGIFTALVNTFFNFCLIFVHFGVPLAIFTGLFLKLSVVWVYLILSQEEMARFLLKTYMFRSKKWMNTIT